MRALSVVLSSRCPVVKRVGPERQLRWAVPRWGGSFLFLSLSKNWTDPTVRHMRNNTPAEQITEHLAWDPKDRPTNGIPRLQRDHNFKS